jgi:prepilin-type N-terminal cleavage/methylation domain-containing protein
MLKRKLRNQKGFTLIEIIAVLVILGILAAVAIPRYFDLQGEARGKALYGALAAMQSTATMAFSEQVLNGASNGRNFAPPTGAIVVGDFTGNVAYTSPIVTVAISTGPPSWNQVPAAYSTSKTFSLWQ